MKKGKQKSSQGNGKANPQSEGGSSHSDTEPQVSSSEDKTGAQVSSSGPKTGVTSTTLPQTTSNESQTKGATGGSSHSDTEPQVSSSEDKTVLSTVLPVLGILVIIAVVVIIIYISRRRRLRNNAAHARENACDPNRLDSNGGKAVFVSNTQSPLTPTAPPATMYNNDYAIGDGGTGKPEDDQVTYAVVKKTGKPKMAENADYALVKKGNTSEEPVYNAEETVVVENSGYGAVGETGAVENPGYGSVEETGIIENSGYGSVGETGIVRNI